jgi:hypothetical protein
MRVAGSMQQFVIVAGVAEACHLTLRHYRTAPLLGHMNGPIVSGGWACG